MLDAPAVEITYGLERILMARQGVKHFKDIKCGRAATPAPPTRACCTPAGRPRRQLGPSCGGPVPHALHRAAAVQAGT